MSGLSIEQLLQLQEKIIALEKKIQKTETAVWKEIQPQKRFTLYNELQKYKSELEDLKRGKAQNVYA